MKPTESILAIALFLANNIASCVGMRSQHHQHHHQHQINNVHPNNQPTKPFWTAAVGVFAGLSLTMITAPALAANTASTSVPVALGANGVVSSEPQDTDNQLVQMAFRDFDQV